MCGPELGKLYEYLMAKYRVADAQVLLQEIMLQKAPISGMHPPLVDIKGGEEA